MPGLQWQRRTSRLQREFQAPCMGRCRCSPAIYRRASTRGTGLIHVLLVDDSPSVRAVLKRFFSRTRDIRVVGEAGDGEQAVQAVLDLQPHVVVMDLQMPV